MKHHPSMEGRTIARPDSLDGIEPPRKKPVLQWRAGQLPGQTVGAAVGAKGTLVILQWRAGQLPGQTWCWSWSVLLLWPPSMEGRTIARPDLAVLEGTRRRHLPSMEDRTIARPDHPQNTQASTQYSPFNGGPDNCPARPRKALYRHVQSRPFNGGPDNCPARPGRPHVDMPLMSTLQWRAGQLPGQTSDGTCCRTKNNTPSMEGRTIARPDLVARLFGC